MELVVRKTDLLKELSLLQGIVERKNTIPILANVLLERDEGSRLAARDRSRRRPAQPMRRDGVEAGNADAAGEETVRDRQCAAGDGHSDRGRQGRQERDDRGRSLRVADADAAGERVSDAAAGWRAARKRCCRVPALKRMISHTRFAITSEDTRYFLNGAQLVLRPDSMSMVATDGHRLAFISVHESPGKSAKTDVLLPRKTLNEVARLIDGGTSSSSRRAKITCSSRRTGGC